MEEIIYRGRNAAIKRIISLGLAPKDIYMSLIKGDINGPIQLD